MSDLVGLAAAYATINAKIEELQEMKERIRDQILDSADFGSHEAGGLTVTIRHNRRLNTTRFAEVYSPDEHPELFKSVPDTAAIKQHLAPVAVESLYDEGAPVVIVKGA